MALQEADGGRARATPARAPQSLQNSTSHCQTLAAGRDEKGQGRWHDGSGRSRAVASGQALLVQTFPDRFVATVSKSRRAGKIFIDYLRNAAGATAVCAYSLGARANAPVATPIAWEELAQDVRFDHFNLRSMPARAQTLKRDPWHDFFTFKQSVARSLLKRFGITS